MINLISSQELKSLKNTISTLRFENKLYNEEIRKLGFEIGEWKSKNVLLQKEVKTLKRKLRREIKKNDNVKKDS